MNWLKVLLHRHMWENIKSYKIDFYRPEDVEKKMPTRYKWVFIQKCKICGKLQRVVFKEE